MSLKPVKAIIFDCDGTLLDTESVYAKTFHQYTGLELTLEDKIKTCGTNSHSCGVYLCKTYNFDRDPDEFMDGLNALLRDNCKEANLLPGAEKIIKEVISKNIPCSIATGSIRKNFEAKINKNKALFDLIKHTTCGDEVANGKPDPEVFLKSMEKMGIKDPADVLVIEDSGAGVRGANNAGMQVVMIPDKDLPLETTLKNYDAKPTMILKSLEELDLSVFGL